MSDKPFFLAHFGKDIFKHHKTFKEGGAQFLSTSKRWVIYNRPPEPHKFSHKLVLFIKKLLNISSNKLSNLSDLPDNLDRNELIRIADHFAIEYPAINKLTLFLGAVGSGHNFVLVASAIRIDDKGDNRYNDYAKLRDDWNFEATAPDSVDSTSYDLGANDDQARHIQELFEYLPTPQARLREIFRQAYKDIDVAQPVVNNDHDAVEADSTLQIDNIDDQLPNNAKAKKDVRIQSPKNYPNTVLPIECDQETQWRDIKITFISDEEIHIQIDQESHSRRFNNAGFEDRRNGRPISSWSELCEVAIKNKCISFDFNNRPTVEKTVQTLNKKLAALFPCIPHRPIELNKDKTTYYFKFQLESTI